MQRVIIILLVRYTAAADNIEHCPYSVPPEDRAATSMTEPNTRVEQYDRTGGGQPITGKLHVCIICLIMTL